MDIINAKSGVAKVNRSIGIIEVVGMTVAVAIVDTMTKSAFVEVYSIKHIGSGIVTIIIQGDLASVQVAIEIGKETAANFGELISFTVIPRPYEGLEKMLAPEEKGDLNEKV